MDTLAQILLVAACLVIICRAEPALNRMGETTPLLIRIAFHLLALCAASGILYTLTGKVPDWLTVLFAIAAAALLFCERRIKVLTRIRSNPHQNKGAPHA